MDYFGKKLVIRDITAVAVAVLYRELQRSYPGIIFELEALDEKATIWVRGKTLGHMQPSIEQFWEKVQSVFQDFRVEVYDGYER